MVKLPKILQALLEVVAAWVPAFVQTLRRIMTLCSTDLPPHEYNLMSRELCRRKFTGDVIAALDGSRALQEYLEFFQISREGQPMGIVEHDL